MRRNYVCSVATLLLPRSDYVQPQFISQPQNRAVDLSHPSPSAPSETARPFGSTEFESLAYLRAHHNGICYVNGPDTRRAGSLIGATSLVGLFGLYAKWVTVGCVFLFFWGMGRGV